MLGHQATADENAGRHALDQILQFSSFDYDADGSFGKSVGNIIHYVNWNEFLIFVCCEIPPARRCLIRPASLQQFFHTLFVSS